MKLASFTFRGRSSFGIITGDGIIDAGARLKGRYASLASALAEQGALQTLRDKTADFSLADVKLLPPVPSSGRITCVGLNYKTHIKEMGMETPAYPILFPRYPDSLVASGEPMVRPRLTDKFDYEGELAVVIGKAGRHICAENALDHVAGYSCLNDGSLRDFQSHTSQFMPGKNFWHSGAFGPWLVTPDEFGEISKHSLTTRLNGQIVQYTGLDDLLFGVPELIAYISQIWPLQAGDVIATGTTGGVAAARKPPLWMRPGDQVEVEIDGIGVLTNDIIAEEVPR